MRRRPLALAPLAVAAWLAAAAPAAAAPPLVSYDLAGLPGSPGWFRGPVTVTWLVQGATSTSGCEAAVRVSRDTRGTTRTCRATNAEGSTTVRTRVIRIDATPPAATGATPARPPDTNGFYRGPVGVAWTGVDATSGIATCTALTFAGPDGAAAPAGGCTDVAGNVSAPLGFALRYDATAPAVTAAAAAADGLVSLSWAAGDAQRVVVARSPGAAGAPASVVFEGTGSSYVDAGVRNGVGYTYAVTATDAAGNAATASATAVPRARLAGPRRTTFGAPPLLRWRPVRRASYYNVQLFRGPRKILSTWPTRPRLQLRTTWRYRGRRERLLPGSYRWYVWPGYGPRSRHRYGRVLGTRRFTVVAPRAQ